MTMDWRAVRERALVEVHRTARQSIVIGQRNRQVVISAATVRRFLSLSEKAERLNYDRAARNGGVSGRGLLPKMGRRRQECSWGFRKRTGVFREESNRIDVRRFFRWVNGELIFLRQPDAVVL